VQRQQFVESLAAIGGVQGEQGALIVSMREQFELDAAAQAARADEHATQLATLRAQAAQQAAQLGEQSAQIGTLQAQGEQHSATLGQHSATLEELQAHVAELQGGQALQQAATAELEARQGTSEAQAAAAAAALAATERKAAGAKALASAAIQDGVSLAGRVNAQGREQAAALDQERTKRQLLEKSRGKQDARLEKLEHKASIAQHSIA
jgi:hypothetical protein